MTKTFLLKASDIRSVATGYGSCFATDMITVEGYPVAFMYRELGDNDLDSGWRFFSGRESDAYIENQDNLGLYDVNTIANYDRTIIPFLDAPAGSAFEKTEGRTNYIPLTDWTPPEESED